MTVEETFKARLLVVGGERSGRAALERRLGEERYAIDNAENAIDALERIAESPPDAVIVSLEIPSIDGLELIKQLRERDDTLPVFAVASPHARHTAADAIRAGAEEYITTPDDFTALVLLLERALERRDVRVENENLHRQLRERAAQGLEGLIGASPAMQRVYRAARQAAKSRAAVLVTGERGTGKSELARAIHALSSRADKPFVVRQGAATVESWRESELFGHEAGAFPGADKARIGCFERAQEGTLFLGEIAEIPMSTQVKLVWSLRERAIRRLGSRTAIAIDVRLVASTSHDLAAAVRKRRFREDLYHRLSVVQIEMPPLRHRGGDALVLAHYFLRRSALESHKPLEGFTDAARAKILAYPWPGNVRALESVITFAANTCEGPFVDEADLPFDPAAEMLGAIRIPGSTMAELERHAILKTLEATGGSTTKAAELLDISVRTIQYRLHRYQVSAKESR